MKFLQTQNELKIPTEFEHNVSHVSKDVKANAMKWTRWRCACVNFFLIVYVKPKEAVAIWDVPTVLVCLCLCMFTDYSASMNTRTHLHTHTAIHGINFFSHTSASYWSYGSTYTHIISIILPIWIRWLCIGLAKFILEKSK